LANTAKERERASKDTQLTYNMWLIDRQREREKEIEREREM